MKKENKKKRCISICNEYEEIVAKQEEICYSR